MDESLEMIVKKNKNDSLEDNKVHQSIIYRYEHLQEGMHSKKRTKLEQNWSALKFGAYKWGFIVPFMYGSVGGDIAKMWQDTLSVNRKLAVGLNALATAMTDSIWLLSGNKIIDTAFYMKLGVTQGWNVYRLIHNEKENPKLAIGFETIVAIAPYTKHIINKSIDLVDENVDKTKKIIKSSMPRPLKQKYDLLKEYYVTQAIIQQESIFNIAVSECAEELQKSMKFTYSLLPFAMQYFSKK